MPEKKKVGTIKYKDGREESVYALEATEEENKASLEKTPFFIGTIEYFATGEGMTQEVIACRAADEEEFKDQLAKTSVGGAWYASGASIYKNQIPEEDRIYQLLVSDRISKYFSNIISGRSESGYMNFHTSMYQNFS